MGPSIYLQVKTEIKNVDQNKEMKKGIGEWVIIE